MEKKLGARMKGEKPQRQRSSKVEPIWEEFTGKKPKVQGKLSEPPLLDIPWNTSTSQPGRLAGGWRKRYREVGGDIVSIQQVHFERKKDRSSK
jgi:hypothetical protein